MNRQQAIPQLFFPFFPVAKDEYFVALQGHGFGKSKIGTTSMKCVVVKKVVSIFLLLCNGMDRIETTRCDGERQQTGIDVGVDLISGEFQILERGNS